MSDPSLPVTAGPVTENRIVIDREVAAMSAARHGKDPRRHNATRRLRTAALQLDQLSAEARIDGIGPDREPATLTAAQLRLAADLLEHPDFGYGA